MCGIVGAFCKSEPILAGMIAGLERLEYRGYDSVGIGLVRGNEIVVRRRAGRIADLVERLQDGELDDLTVGIGHSRWATHGAPTDENAHPHTDAEGHLALVHNGIIENFAELREELIGQGFPFASETDTEVLVHLIARERRDESISLSEAVRLALQHVRGYYAIAVLAADPVPELVCAREGPPICVGATSEGVWLASDVLALLPYTREVVFLEDGDVAQLEPGRITVRDSTGAVVERAPRTVTWEAEDADKGSWPHFMLKEIHEQPDVVSRTTFDRLDLSAGDVRLEGDTWTDERLRRVERIQVVACGTALHAGLVASYLIEGIAGVPVDVDFASEFRYREPLVVDNTLAIGISQSGETADTLAALRLAAQLGSTPASICNSESSTMVRESADSILIHAGPEIGVASTKAFVAMLAAAYLLAIRLGRARGRLDAAAGQGLLQDLLRVRPALEGLLTRASIARVRSIAERHQNAKGFLFLGRGINYPIALEGALKLKEISYAHAEGYPAGEMKHGPIAMIEPDMTTVVLAPDDPVAEKVRSNIEQVRARGGPVVCMGSHRGSLEAADEALEIPEINRWLSPILNVVPLQLLAYFIAELKGCDIDKPRNLAKSVTVE